MTMNCNLPASCAPKSVLRPAVDIYETEERLTILADLPGVDKKDLSLQVDDNLLTLEAEPKATVEEKLLRREFRLTKYHRQFILPDEVDQDKISAELKDGVLRVRLPRAEGAKPRRIKVKVR